MPYVTFGREVVRGTITRTRWIADITLMCSDRVPLGAVSHVFVEIRWRARRDEGDVPGQPEDAKPVVLTLTKRSPSATGELRFDGPDGPSSRGFNGDARTLLTVFGRSATSSAEGDLAL